VQDNVTLSSMLEEELVHGTQIGLDVRGKMLCKAAPLYVTKQLITQPG